MAQRELATDVEGSPISNDAEGDLHGAEAYAFDPQLRADALVGLERLRSVEDREIAGLLFKLYRHLERRELAQTSAPKPPIVKTQSERWTQVALNALAGKCGIEARELAEYFLKGDDGRDQLDEASVKAFARGYEKLRSSTGAARVSYVGRAKQT